MNQEIRKYIGQDCYIRLSSKAELVSADDSVHVPLSVTEFKILDYFITHANTPVYLEELAQQLWGINYNADQKDLNSLKSHISSVRNKLEKIRSGLKTDKNCLCNKEIFQPQLAEVLGKNSQIDTHMYHEVIHDAKDKGTEDVAGTSVANSSQVECFIRKFEELRIKAKYLYYRITDDKDRDVDIYIRSDGAMYVEGYKTEFNILDIREMKYDFYDYDESANITLYFGQNTSLSFSSEYYDNQLYLSIDGNFFSGRSATLKHWEELEQTSLKADENCLYSKEIFPLHPAEVLSKSSQIDAHTYLGAPVANSSQVECFIRKFKELRIKAKYLPYWRITSDKCDRNIPIYISPDGTIYVEQHKTEFNILDIREMKYNFHDDDETANITLHFGQNTNLSFSSEYSDDQLFLSISGDYLLERSGVLKHWDELEETSL